MIQINSIRLKKSVHLAFEELINFKFDYNKLTMKIYHMINLMKLIWYHRIIDMSSFFFIFVKFKIGCYSKN